MNHFLLIKLRGERVSGNVVTCSTELLFVRNAMASALNSPGVHNLIKRNCSTRRNQIGVQSNATNATEREYCEGAANKTFRTRRNSVHLTRLKWSRSDSDCLFGCFKIVAIFWVHGKRLAYDVSKAAGIPRELSWLTGYLDRSCQPTHVRRHSLPIHRPHALTDENRKRFSHAPHHCEPPEFHSPLSTCDARRRTIAIFRFSIYYSTC